MSNRHELRDRWYWEDLRARETPDFERETAAPVERNVGDPRWGTGGMRGDELGYRAAHDASEGSWAGELRRSVVVRTAQPQVEWQSEATPVIPLEPPPWAPGPFVGRGPRGYRRSDERIREEVCERFTAHGALDPTDVEVTVRGGEVMLSGTISTRAQKRLAEDVAAAVFGVVEVQNRLRVRRLLIDPRPPVGGTEGCLQQGMPAEHR